MQPPRWRRWLVRLLVLLAFGGVAFGLFTIISDGTKDSGEGAPVALRQELQALERASEALAGRLDALEPRGKAGPARRGARRALTAQRRAVAALRKAQAEGDAIAQEQQTEAALNADFDWLDGVHTVLRKPSSRIAGDLGARGEAAIAAFDALDVDYGLGSTVRGVGALLTWVDAQ